MGKDVSEKELDALRNNLRQLKGTLEKQRKKAQNELFDNFLEEIMKLDIGDERAETMRSEYLESLTALSNEEVPLGERMSEFLDSEFLLGVLTHKNLRYEREIRRFLTHLNDLLGSVSKEGATKDSQFMERYFKTALSGVMDIVEPTSAENHEEIASMIVGALQEPLKYWFR